jgi:hypothetical protein
MRHMLWQLLLTIAFAHSVTVYQIGDKRLRKKRKINWSFPQCTSELPLSFFCVCPPLI